MTRRFVMFLETALVLCMGAASVYAQGRGRGGGPPQPPRTAQAAAPIDLTGYWVSMVTEDWRYRMLTPPKGDYVGVPLNPEGRKVADAWDPAKDEAAGDQCKSYGAANIMRVPMRIHVTWQDDQTLKMETDAGNQTRLFYFGAPRGQGGDWQGVSTASWDLLPGAIGTTDGGRARFGATDQRGGSLKVVTTKLKAGYLRKNGVPYSANTVVTEYYDVVTEPSGVTYMIVTTTVEDPMYLTQPFLTSTNFKKQADNSGWKPAPCTAQ